MKNMKKIMTTLMITGFCFGMTMTAAAADESYSTTIRTGAGGYTVTDEHVEETTDVIIIDNGSIESPDGEIIIINNKKYYYDGKYWYVYNEITKKWERTTNPYESTSPKTGMPMDYTLYAGAALVLAGSAIVLKKREA